MRQLVTICDGGRQGKSVISLVAQIFNVSWDIVTQEQAAFAMNQIEFTSVYHHITNAIKTIRESQLSKSEIYLKWYGGAIQHTNAIKAPHRWHCIEMDFEKLEQTVEALLHKRHEHE